MLIDSLGYLHYYLFSVVSILGCYPAKGRNLNKYTRVVTEINGHRDKRSSKFSNLSNNVWSMVQFSC